MTIPGKESSGVFSTQLCGPADELTGIALIIVALCGGYYLVRRAGMLHSLRPGQREEP